MSLTIILPVCNNNVCIQHRFLDITSFTVYVTACDLEKSFILDSSVKFIGPYAFWFMCKHLSGYGFKNVSSNIFKKATSSIKIIYTIRQTTCDIP